MDFCRELHGQSIVCCVSYDWLKPFEFGALYEEMAACFCVGVLLIKIPIPYVFAHFVFVLRFCNVELTSPLFTHNVFHLMSSM